MSRIASLATSNQLISQILATQKRITETSFQVTTEQVSPNYTGIDKIAERLINFETLSNSLANFVSSNQQVDTRLETINVSINGARETLLEFRNALVDFNTFGNNQEAQVRDIQDFAFRTLQSVQGFLNVNLNGDFQFGGTRAEIAPINIGPSNLTDFQSRFDGQRVTYPTTREAQLAQFTINKDVADEKTNFLTFERDDGTTPPVGRITATGTNNFANAKVGTTIVVSGTGNSGLNDGTYTIKGIDSTNGQFITVETVMLTDEAAGPSVTLTTPDGATIVSTDFTFNRANDTITSGVAGQLSSIPVGSTITISGSTNNNGAFTVSTNTGTAITISSQKLTDQGTTAAPLLSFTNAGTVTFTDNTAPTKDTISSGVPGTFSELRTGMIVAFTNVSGANAGPVTVSSVSADGSTITVDENLTAETDVVGTAPELIMTTQETGGTINALPFFNGDTRATTHRLSARQSFELDVTAADPAFEKAFRAMALISQGKFGTAGGLDQNENRVEEALFLIASAIDNSSNPNVTAVAQVSTVDFTAATVGVVAPVAQINTADFTAATVGAPSDSHTVTINTAPAGTPVTISVPGGGTTTTITAAMATAINNNTSVNSLVNATANGDVLTLTAATPGIGFSSVSSTTLATAATDAVGTANAGDTHTVTINTLPSGTPVSISVNGTGTTATITAAMAIAINNNTSINSLVNANASGGVLTLTAATSGVGFSASASTNLATAAVDSVVTTNVASLSLGTPPFGQELTSNFEQLLRNIGFDQVLLLRVNEGHNTLKGFLDGRISDFENIDPAEAITRLLNEQQSLEVSFQILGRVRQLSLANFLS